MALLDRAHRFSSAEYHRLVDAGALDELRVELLDGVLVDVGPQGALHAVVIQRLMVALAAHLPRLRVQMPLEVADGWLPEPDLAVADPSAEPTRTHPSTADLVVEVAVSSQDVDHRKATVYAAAGVRSYWLVDVPAREVVVRSAPTPDGYGTVEHVSADGVLDAGLVDVVPISVAALLDA